MIADCKHASWREKIEAKFAVEAVGAGFVAIGQNEEGFEAALEGIAGVDQVHLDGASNGLTANVTAQHLFGGGGETDKLALVGKSRV